MSIADELSVLRVLMADEGMAVPSWMRAEAMPRLGWGRVEKLRLREYLGENLGVVDDLARTLRDEGARELAWVLTCKPECL